mmetsp:Transcript_38942/g.69677  ORF Transcript_38942/g.69677 Transcript_38942/m.69677 type:complete len:104 (+) Transcript_38942:47-358(+)
MQLLCTGRQEAEGEMPHRRLSVLTKAARRSPARLRRGSIASRLVYHYARSMPVETKNASMYSAVSELVHAAWTVSLPAESCLLSNNMTRVLMAVPSCSPPHAG